MAPKQTYLFLFFICTFLLAVTTLVKGLPPKKPASLIFISDCQEPLMVEKLFLRAYNNGEGREKLLQEIEKEKAETVFMLGDLVGSASDDQAWKGIDAFLENLRQVGTSVYAVPGNHEYLLRPTQGIANFQKRFPKMPLTGSCIRMDSIAIVLLNSNFSRLSVSEAALQLKWYGAIMDSLDLDGSIKMIVLSTHHSPYSNSKVVGSSKEVQEAFIPRFRHSPKAKLLLSGHSHNLEYFNAGECKYCMVIGGGGGLDQSLYTGTTEKYKDLIAQAIKPRFFYIVIQRDTDKLKVFIRGFSRELLPVSEISLSL